MKKKKKLLFVVLDGAADKPVKQYKRKTPFEVADTPNLDFLALHGVTGKLDLLGKIPPETDSGVLALFGYDPFKRGRCRAVLEAYALGIPFEKGDVVMRGNFATVEDSYIVDVRAGRIPGKDAKKLIDDLNRQLELESWPVEARVYHTLNYRSILVLHPLKGKLSDQISNTHPAYLRKPKYVEIPVPVKGKMKLKKCRALDDKKMSKVTAKLVNEFTKKSIEILDSHRINEKRKKEGLLSANGIILRAAGNELPKLDNLEEKYGYSWFCLGDTPVERGIAKLLGMDLVEDLPELKMESLKKNASVEEIKKAVRKDMKIRVKKLFEVWDKYDAFYLHIKGADPFGHAGRPEAKKAVIEALDEFLFGKILKNIDMDETIVCVTSDHTTACSARAHTADPVPVVIAGDGFKPDNVKKFGENYFKKGKLGVMKATKLLRLLMKKMGG
ncbi:MAG: 2,3-bisphosphoglycerate-independent phosphoglycerate mutase [Candidatus Aenigmarchaeota archaeon]|nr:2,3-bisphosphoglycerate-independent phosphoglycerate mutase [Candidatus Aenigmarchaeota archaeon]